MLKPGMISGRRTLAILRKRCPNCLRGPMFAGLLRMREECPDCEHRFMREPGFFQGAMYVSYILGIVEFAVLAVLSYWWLGERLGTVGALGVAAVLHLLLVPQLYRYSRVLWAHACVGTLDDAQSPEASSPEANGVQ